jgi:hypothetical protein
MSTLKISFFGFLAWVVGWLVNLSTSADPNAGVGASGEPLQCSVRHGIWQVIIHPTLHSIFGRSALKEHQISAQRFLPSIINCALFDSTKRWGVSCAPSAHPVPLTWVRSVRGFPMEIILLLEAHRGGAMIPLPRWQCSSTNTVQIIYLPNSCFEKFRIIIAVPSSP